MNLAAYYDNREIRTPFLLVNTKQSLLYIFTLSYGKSCKFMKAKYVYKMKWNKLL